MKKMILSLLCCLFGPSVHAASSNTLSSESESSASSSSQRFSFDAEKIYLSYGYSNYNDIIGAAVVENNFVGDYKLASDDESDWTLGAGYTAVAANSVRNPSFNISYTKKYDDDDDDDTKLNLAYELSYAIQPVPSSTSLPDDMIYQQNKITLGWSRYLNDDLQLSTSANGYIFDRNLMNYIRSYTNLGLVSRTGRLMVDS